MDEKRGGKQELGDCYLQKQVHTYSKTSLAISRKSKCKG
jgi:hypothetical protein